MAIEVDTIETAKGRLIQRTAAEEYLRLHPETDASIVIVASKNVTADNVQDALEEIVAEINRIEGAYVTGIRGEAETDANEDGTLVYRTGDVTITKENLGLENVDNTSDVNKPVSTATQEAIDKVVSDIETDLEDYYNKSEIDNTVSELKSDISAIPKFGISVVEELPEDDISESTIYLIANDGTEDGNVYTEYIYSNGEWEKLGEQRLDLSGYSTTEEINALLSETLESYYNKEDIDSLLAEKQDNLTIDEELSSTSENPVQNKVIEAKFEDVEKSIETAQGAIDDLESGATAAGRASKLASEITVDITGDATGETTTDGSEDVEIEVTLKDSGVSAGTYSAVSVNEKGIVTAGAQLVEIGEEGQDAPSDLLAVGGIFFERI